MMIKKHKDILHFHRMEPIHRVVLNVFTHPVVLFKYCGEPWWNVDKHVTFRCQSTKHNFMEPKSSKVSHKIVNLKEH